jgi:hypothetical protein
MAEQKNTAAAEDRDGIKEINRKLDTIVDYLKCLHKIQFSSLILMGTNPLGQLHQSLAESVQQEGAEWYRKTQENFPKRKGIHCLGDLSQLSQSRDNEEE